MHRAEDAERADENELTGHQSQFAQRIDEITCLPEVHTVEVRRVDALGDARTVDNIVECAMRLQLLTQDIRPPEVQLQEMDARVLQIGTTARGAHARPSVEATAQSLFYKETADETAGAGDKDTAWIFARHSSLVI